MKQEKRTGRNQDINSNNQQEENNMNIVILDQVEENGSQYIELATEKKAAFISFNKKKNYVNVICKNAAHQAYKGSGRHFWNGWSDALAAYKSHDMKAMIEAAKQLTL